MTNQKTNQVLNGDFKKTCGNCGHSKPYKDRYVMCPDINEYMDSDWDDVCEEWILEDIPQKTCGTCGHGIKTGFEVKCYDRKGFSIFITDIGNPACNHYKDAGLEQRYQELVHEAQSMIHDMQDFEKYIRDEAYQRSEMTNQEAMFIASIMNHEDRLKSLGVEIDG